MLKNPISSPSKKFFKNPLAKKEGNVPELIKASPRNRQPTS